MHKYKTGYSDETCDKGHDYYVDWKNDSGECPFCQQIADAAEKARQEQKKNDIKVVKIKGYVLDSGSA